MRQPDDPLPEEMRPIPPPPQNPPGTGLDIVEVSERGLVLKLDENGTIKHN